MVNKCDNCFKVIKDNEEVFETNEGNYICFNCMENRNTQYELLCEDR